MPPPNACVALGGGTPSTLPQEGGDGCSYLWRQAGSGCLAAMVAKISVSACTAEGGRLDAALLGICRESRASRNES